MSSRNITVAVLAFVALVLWGYYFVAVQPGVQLPPHQLVDSTPIPPKDGKRIQVNVDSEADRWVQCKALIHEYEDRAGPQGQVSVHKPSPALEVDLLPWCWQNNDDGQGVQFASKDFFPNAK